MTAEITPIRPDLPAKPARLTTMDLIELASALTTFLLSLEEDPTEEEREQLRDQLFMFNQSAEEKVRGLHYVIGDMVAKAEFLRQEETRIARKRKRLLAESDSLKRLTAELLLASREIDGQEFIQCETVKATLRTNYRVIVPDVDELARVCPDLVEVKTSTVPNKVAIKADLKKHPEREIPASLMASHWVQFT